MEDFKVGDKVIYKIVESQVDEEGVIVYINNDFVGLKVGNGFIVLDREHISHIT